LLQLIVVELFRPTPEPVALQTSDQQAQPLDLGDGGAQDQL